MTSYPSGKARALQIAKATRKRRLLQDTCVSVGHAPRIGEFYTIARRYIHDARMSRQNAIIGRQPIPDPCHAINSARKWLGYARALRREQARQLGATPLDDERREG